MEIAAEFSCAFCGENNLTFIDLTAGMYQRYTEDCQVCCRPNSLYITVDEENLEVEINTNYEE
jgi:hypothetical protein